MIRATTAMVVSLLALGMALAAPMARAWVPPDLWGRRVLRVEIVGEARGAVETAAIGIEPGQLLDRSLMRDTIARLLESGRWADAQIDVAAEDAGVVLYVELVPRFILARISVFGNDVLGEAEVLRALDLREGAEMRRELVRTEAGRTQFRSRLLRAYRERGYERVAVEFELRDTDDPSRKALVVRIEEGQPTRIGRIRFVGDQPPRDARMGRTLEIDEGDVYDRREVDEALRDASERLRERGWYGAELELGRVSPTTGGEAERESTSTDDSPTVQLSVLSRLGPRYEVRVRGPGPLDRDTVVDALDLDAEPLTVGSTEAAAERVRDLYARRGFPQALVSVMTLPSRRRGVAYLVVQIEAGPARRVTEVRFPGAQHFSEEFLREQLSGFVIEAVDFGGLADPVDRRTVNALMTSDREARLGERRPSRRPILPDQIDYEPAYEAAIEHIERVYERDGFLSARIGPRELRTWPRNGDERAHVSIPIEEGPRSHVYELTIRGNEAIGEREIADALGLERGQPFSRQLLSEAQARIEALYRNEGFLYARAEATVRFSGDRTRTAVDITIIELYPVTVGQILIEGATRTNESIISNLVALETGEVFRPRDAQRTQDRLMELGIFTSVTVSVGEPDLPARVKPVIVSVSERRAQFLDFRAGVSTAQGVRGGFEYGYRNLFGKAIGLTLRVQLANQFFFLDNVLAERIRRLSLADRLERRITIGVQLPYLPRLPNTRASMSVSHVRDNQRAFGLDSNKIDFTFTVRPLRQFYVTLSSGLENNDVDLFSDEEYEELLRDAPPGLRSLLRVPEGRSTLVTGLVGATLDLRDNPFTPKRGFYTNVEAEWGRTIATQTVEVGGTDERFFSHHIRAEMTLNGYAPLGPMTLAMQGRVGRVFHLSDRSKTYPNRQFFLGGVDTVRGYLQDSLVPQDLADEGITSSQVTQGGDVFMVLRAELRFPIRGMIYGGLFTDFGNLWAQAGQLNPLELRPTAGLGLRFQTPVGPVAFDYGFLLARRRELDERIGSFHFSIGLF